MVERTERAEYREWALVLPLLDYYWPKPDWAEQPRYVIDAYIEALPRILAQESLRTIRDYALGSGRLKREDHTAILRSIERAAARGLPKPEARAPEPGALAGIGIGVRQ